MKIHKTFSHVWLSLKVKQAGIFLCLLELKQLSLELELYVSKGD